MTLILASASPRRSELLGRAGVRFEIVPTDIDETQLPAETPRRYAARVAEAKAQAGRRARADAWILAADTIVVIDEVILGKAVDADHAEGMLHRLSGRTHIVMTATSLLGPDERAARRLFETAVSFRPLTSAEIRNYVAGGEWRGKAGAYAAQGQAAAFVTELRGSYTNVVGLPLAETLMDLETFGIARPNYAGNDHAG